MNTFFYVAFSIVSLIFTTDFLFRGVDASLKKANKTNNPTLFYWTILKLLLLIVADFYLLTSSILKVWDI